MGLSTSDAADVFQEVCLLLLNHLENLRDHSRLAAWIVVTTRHEVYRLYRKRGPKVVSELSDGELWMMDNLTDADQVSSMDEHVIALDRRLRLKLAIEGMPDRCRGLLTLLYLNDPAESYINIAEKLQIPTGSIGPVRTRCLKRLRKILENEDF